jgi:hypothetical protein
VEITSFNAEKQNKSIKFRLLNVELIFIKCIDTQGLSTRHVRKLAIVNLFSFSGIFWLWMELSTKGGYLLCFTCPGKYNDN